MTAVLGIGVAALVGKPASAVNAQQPTVVSETPSEATPNAVDGAVFAITQVGDTVLMGGSFTQVQPPDRSATYSLPYVVAFDAATGTVNTAFDPQLDGAVNALLPGPVAGTVYVGGAFATMGGVRSKGLVLLNVSDGTKAAGFTTPPTNGIVQTVKRVGNRLFVGGTFTNFGGQARGGLATIDASNGALDSFLTSTVSVNHNWTPTNGGAKGAVQVSKLDITPDGRRMVAIGNFKKVDGLDRDQVAMWDLTGPTAVLRPDWATHRYEAACFFRAFDSYVRDLDISPDGSYFVIGATGGGNSGTLCDSTARWEMDASGTDVQPTWAAFSGGDTFLSVAVTGTAVYAGGHMRWMNNPNARDSAGPGAVPRPGLVALDPANGMPLSWNPGRNPRGAGASALYATPEGLWVGSDTNFIGNFRYARWKIAFFPLAGGSAPASTAVQTLPGGVYLGAAQQAAASTVLYRVNAGGGPLQASDSGPDWTDGSANVSGGNTAGWSPVPNVTAAVPATTPRSIFDSERWGAQQWTFPIPAGAQVKVRLYFANRCTCTSGVGQRVFSVSINGTTVLPDYDIVADVGDQTGTMKEFPNVTATADGAVHVGFANVVENPLINGIEIVRTDVPQPPADAAGALVERDFDGTAAGASTPVDSPLDWSTVRGATLVGSMLFYGRTDGLFYRRTFDGTSFGPEELIDPYNDPAWSTVDTGAGQTYRGARPSFYPEIPNVTALFTDGTGQLYYQLFGAGTLYKRAFSADSGIVHDNRIPTGTSLPAMTGAFVSGGDLYYATKADGNLNRVGFSAGAVTGSPTVVSGPALDGIDWRSRALFLGPRIAANVAPTAVAAVTCSALSCAADSAGSTDPDGTIASYAWDWGDGTGSSGATAAHTYASGGTYDVTLTVTDDAGATAAATKAVTVAPPAAAPIAFRAAAGFNANTQTATVTVPAAVRAGDGLVLVATVNNDTPVLGGPAGWTEIASDPTTGIVSKVWSKVATSADAGSVVTVISTTTAKIDLRLAAYSGTSLSSPILSLAKDVDMTASAAHTTPPTTVSVAGSWVLSYWADKSDATTAWTAPAGQTVRSTGTGTGGAHITGLLSDSGTAAAGGPAGGLTATTDAAGNKAVMITIVLAQAS